MDLLEYTRPRAFGPSLPSSPDLCRQRLAWPGLGAAVRSGGVGRYTGAFQAGQAASFAWIPGRPRGHRLWACETRSLSQPAQGLAACSRPGPACREAPQNKHRISGKLTGGRLPGRTRPDSCSVQALPSRGGQFAACWIPLGRGQAALEVNPTLPKLSPPPEPPLPACSPELIPNGVF